MDRPSTRALFQDVEFYRATFGVKEGRIAGTGGGSLVVSLPSCPHTSSSSVRLVLIVQMNHTPTLVRTPTLPSPIAPAFQLAEPHPGSKFTTGLKHNYSFACTIANSIQSSQDVTSIRHLHVPPHHRPLGKKNRLHLPHQLLKSRADTLPEARALLHRRSHPQLQRSTFSGADIDSICPSFTRAPHHCTVAVSNSYSTAELVPDRTPEHSLMMF